MTPERLREIVVACRRCKRLVAHRERVARERKPQFAHEAYWGRPVPTFGARNPGILVVGLAPGAHGANRTGRPFTGDRSGELLYRTLHAAGLATEPVSEGPGDGLRLLDTAITASVRCVPPANRPTAREEANCRPYLVEELKMYPRVRAYVALGRIALGQFLRAWEEAGRPPWDGPPRFLPGAEYRDVSGAALLVSYHPSPHNTLTGRLTPEAFLATFLRAREILRGPR